MFNATQTGVAAEEGASTGFWVGVSLSIVADAIIAVSLNIQKTAHMRNQVRVGGGSGERTVAAAAWRARETAGRAA